MTTSTVSMSSHQHHDNQKQVPLSSSSPYSSPACPLLVTLGGDYVLDSPLPSAQELKASLEKGPDDVKMQAIEQILIMMVNESAAVAAIPSTSCSSIGSEVLMHVIRFALPTQKNKRMKKLLLLFLEMCPKLGADGKLLQEMILVCNALRNDLQHPNEYVRGSTLRLLSKIKEPELLEPLIPSIRANLVRHIQNSAHYKNYAVLHVCKCLFVF